MTKVIHRPRAARQSRAASINQGSHAPPASTFRGFLSVFDVLSHATRRPCYTPYAASVARAQQRLDVHLRRLRAHQPRRASSLREHARMVQNARAIQHVSVTATRFARPRKTCTSPPRSHCTSSLRLYTQQAQTDKPTFSHLSHLKWLNLEPRCSNLPHPGSCRCRLILSTIQRSIKKYSYLLVLRK